MAQSWIIISLGGSIIVPDHIDVGFLKKFHHLILSLDQYRFVIICGGGETNRRYNAAAQKLGRPTNDDLDWIGIRSLKLNAELVRTMFGQVAYPKVIDRPDDLRRVPKERVVIGASFVPGSSSDLDAVLWAKKFKAERLFNLSNISHVYTADPRVDKRAQPVAEMPWSAYRKLVGTTWTPRLNSPFDPIASREAERLGLSVVVMDGKNLPNVRQALEGKKFNGTVLHP